MPACASVPEEALWLQVVNLDPPIFTADNFLDDETCHLLVNGARNSGAMQQSGVGAGGVGSSEGGVNASRRTSSTLLIDATVQAHNRQLRVRALFDRIEVVLIGVLVYACTPAASAGANVAPMQAGAS